MHSTFGRALRHLAALAAVGIFAAMPAAAQTGAKAGTKSAKTAEATAAAEAADAATIKRLLEERFPGARVSNVARSGYFGLYEAQFDGQLIYTDAKVNHVIVGSVYDTATKQNLSEERLRKLNRVAFDSLPLDLAIKKVKGKGTRKLVVFSDADCPFCVRLENELKSVDDITIYTFLYPIDTLHPDAARKSKIIWCSPDRVKSWDEFFASGKLPDNDGECENPIATLQALGQKMRVNATPTLVFADGSIIPGALPRQRLEAELSQAEAELRKVAEAELKKAATAKK